VGVQNVNYGRDCVTLIPNGEDSLLRTYPVHTALSMFNASALVCGMQAILTSKAANKLHPPAPVYDELSDSNSDPYQVMVKKLFGILAQLVKDGKRGGRRIMFAFCKRGEPEAAG